MKKLNTEVVWKILGFLKIFNKNSNLLVNTIKKMIESSSTKSIRLWLNLSDKEKTVKFFGSRRDESHIPYPADQDKMNLDWT